MKAAWSDGLSWPTGTGSLHRWGTTGRGRHHELSGRLRRFIKVAVVCIGIGWALILWKRLEDDGYDLEPDYTPEEKAAVDAWHEASLRTRNYGKRVVSALRTGT